MTANVLGPLPLSAFTGDQFLPSAIPMSSGPFERRRCGQILCCNIRSALIIVGTMEIILSLLSVVRVFTNYYVVVSNTAAATLLIILIAFTCVMLWSVHSHKAAGIIPMIVLEYVSLIFLGAGLVMFIYGQAMSASNLDYEDFYNWAKTWIICFYILCVAEICWKIACLFILHKGYTYLKAGTALVTPDMRTVTVFYPGPGQGQLNCVSAPFETGTTVYVGPYGGPSVIGPGGHPLQQPAFGIATGMMGPAGGLVGPYGTRWSDVVTADQDSWFCSNPVEEPVIIPPPPPPYATIVDMNITQPPKYGDTITNGNNNDNNQQQQEPNNNSTGTN